ncbi:MAG: hypothetical protein MR508_10135 [Lachnospiraceae bacterium]|nr:hypothetical protein [Lachnospiraceae bacterium]
MRIRMKNGHADRKMLLLLAMGAFMTAIGLLAMGSACAGVCLDRMRAGDVAGMLVGLTGCLYGALLLMGRPKKRR